MTRITYLTETSTLVSYMWSAEAGSVSTTVTSDGLVLFVASVVPVFIGLSDGVGGDNLTRVKLEILACFLPCRYKVEDFILMSFLLTPDWIKDHLSFNNIPSVCCSWIDISGLMVIPAGRSLLLDKMDETSIAQFNFIKIGRGRCKCVLYLPRRRQSLTENDCISFSNFENTDKASLTSRLYITFRFGCATRAFLDPIYNNIVLSIRKL